MGTGEVLLCEIPHFCLKSRISILNGFEPPILLRYITIEKFRSYVPVDSMRGLKDLFGTRFAKKIEDGWDDRPTVIRKNHRNRNLKFKRNSRSVCSTSIPPKITKREFSFGFLHLKRIHKEALFGYCLRY
jgi:hypothetical protein